MDELTKNKKRAQRRKRNFIAKALIEDKQFRPKTIQPKNKRTRVSVREIDRYMEELE